MKRFRWLAVLAIAIVFAAAGPAVANASTISHTGVSPHATSFTNYILNGSSSNVGLGVIHVRDGNYTFGNYDEVLQVGTDTNLAFGWATTAGWYTGPGYCTQQLRSDDGGHSFTRQSPDLGPGQHFIGSNTIYIVNAYRC